MEILPDFTLTSYKCGFVGLLKEGLYLLIAKLHLVVVLKVTEVVILIVLEKLSPF